MRALCLTLALLLAGAAQASPLGRWATPEEKSHIEIYECEENLCGRIVHLGEPLGDDGEPRRDEENPEEQLRARPILGLDILRIPSTADRKGVWRKGRIYDPESGNTYKCQMWLEGEDVLQFKGYLGIPLIGRTSTWRRVD